MHKEVVDAKMAYRLLNPGCVVLVSGGDGERDGLFALTWNMPVRKSPGTVALLSGKRHYTYGFIERTRELGISVPDVSIVDAVFGCGSTSGHQRVDKWERFGISRQQPEVIKAPLVEQAIATLECRVEQIVDMGPSALIIAEILTARAAPQHFSPRGAWRFDRGLQLIHHMGGTAFGVTERVVHAKLAKD
jgi:flavin reductase (DIM6/NTAB) family NADH-FMN oxidoreductase RutF